LRSYQCQLGIESEETGAITLRFALDLLFTASALDTAFAEAEIVKQLVAAYLETGATHPEVFFEDPDQR
jgi:hypothetical protein